MVEGEQGAVQGMEEGGTFLGGIQILRGIGELLTPLMIEEGGEEGSLGVMRIGR